MTDHYDSLERRSAEQRETEQCDELRDILAAALPRASGLAAHLEGVDLAALTDRAALAALPVLRKTDLADRQTEADPLGGLAAHAPGAFRHLFMSPGPIFEPGGSGRDWWRLGRFLHAAGFREGDIIQNCFSYHLTPAGHMFDSAAAAIGAAVIPAGIGQTEQQVAAAAHLGATAYAGTPDYLKTVLEKADELGVPLKIARAAVSGGALFPSLKAFYEDRGIAVRQCYATADVGNIAYESEAAEGMIIDEGAIVEIVRPGTGEPLPEGEVGEVVVTTLNPDYPLVRFATGDMSAIMPGQSPCGRTNARIRGWLGRADQTTKVKGMFVRPEQVEALAARFPEAGRIRVVVTRANEADVMTVKVETGDAGMAGALEAALPDMLKLKGVVEAVAPGSLPNDGKVIEDLRDYD